MGSNFTLKEEEDAGNSEASLNSRFPLCNWLKGSYDRIVESITL